MRPDVTLLELLELNMLPFLLPVSPHSARQIPVCRRRLGAWPFVQVSCWRCSCLTVATRQKQLAGRSRPCGQLVSAECGCVCALQRASVGTDCACQNMLATVT